MLAIHPTLCAVNSLVGELGTVPRIKPALEAAVRRLREDFPGDTSVAAGVMMLSDKLDTLLSAYETFLAFNKLGGHHAAVRRCAFTVETLFTPGRRPAHLTVSVPGAAAPCRFLVRPPTAAGGRARIEQPGYYTKHLDQVFRAAAFAPAGEPRVRSSPTLRNVLEVTRDEVHTFLVGLCTAEGVSFELEAGRATLARQAGAEAQLTRRQRLSCGQT
jgi:hypothetical protein